MKKFLLVLSLVFVCCANAFALSDNEYAQLMKNAEFKRADQALSKAWKAAQTKLNKNKNALNNLRQDQREWIKNGRDEEAEELMDDNGWSKLKAYTEATKARAEYLPELVQKYSGNKANKAQAQEPQAKKPEQVKPQAKANNKINKAKANYPALALCTGSSVRLRDNPGTNSEILARADKGDVLVLLKDQSVNGDIWYAADNPAAEGTVWISGQFVDIYSSNNNKPAYKLALDIRMNYGLKPEKARVLYGEPAEVARDKFFFDPAGKELTEEVLIYKNFELRYVENRLRHVEVSGAGAAFGNLLIGQESGEVVKALGTPTARAEDDSSFTYEITPNESFLFEFDEDGIITHMTWDEYMDG